MKKKLYLLLVLVLGILFLTGCKIKVNKSSTDYSKMNYKDVISDLTDAGFNDISKEVIPDLTSTCGIADGTVSSVTIGKTNEFEANDKFDKKSKVIVTYHIIKREKIPFSIDELQEIDTDKYLDLMKKAGFINATTKTIYDLDPDKVDVGYINELQIDSKKIEFNKGDKKYFDAPICLVHHMPYEKFDVTINVEVIPNLFFNKDDILVYVDKSNKALGTVKHGKSNSFRLRLKEGEHIIKFVDASYTGETDEINIDVSSNLEAAFKISVGVASISASTKYMDYDVRLAENEIKIGSSSEDFRTLKYNDVISKLKKDGFTNIKESPIYDIYFGLLSNEGEVESVSINGEKNFKRGNVYKKNANVVVSYHSYYTNDPNYLAEKQDNNYENESTNNIVEEEYEKFNSNYEMPMRAVVVALTNSYADDVFALDGSPDHSKDHSYNDLSGFYMSVSNYGKWKKDGENKWYFKNLKCVPNSTTTVFKVDSACVTYDGSNYIISNIKGSAGYNIDLSSLELYSSDYLTVPFSSVSEERGGIRMSSDISSYDDGNVLYDSDACAAVELYGKKSYPYGFSLINTEQECRQRGDGAWIINSAAKIKNAYGKKEKIRVYAIVTGTNRNAYVDTFTVDSY